MGYADISIVTIPFIRLVLYRHLITLIGFRRLGEASNGNEFYIPRKVPVFTEWVQYLAAVGILHASVASDDNQTLSVVALLSAWAALTPNVVRVFHS